MFFPQKKPNTGVKILPPQILQPPPPPPPIQQPVQPSPQQPPQQQEQEQLIVKTYRAYSSNSRTTWFDNWQNDQSKFYIIYLIIFLF
jgi:hypothetical protein